MSWLWDWKVARPYLAIAAIGLIFDIFVVIDALISKSIFGR